jgi:hypothetical protein
MDDLVDRLISGAQPVRLGRPGSSVDDLRGRVDDHGCVFACFTGTRGGTEVLITVRSVSGLAATAPHDAAPVRLVGEFVLNSVPLVCELQVSADTLEGVGVLTTAAGRD